MDIERLKQDIEQEHKSFQTYEGRHDAYLYDLFRNAPTESVDKVLEKAKKLNAFYKARVSNNDLQIIAERIVDCKDFDKMLEKWSMKPFDLIANKSGDQEKNAKVFASKYCHFSNSKEYPLYDSRSRKSLYKYYNEVFSTERVSKLSLENYETYKGCLDKLLERLKMDGKYKKIDEFLWLKNGN